MIYLFINYFLLEEINPAVENMCNCLLFLRLFRVVQFSSGLTTLAMALKKSLPELINLAIFTLMTVLLFAAMCYYDEKEEAGTSFESISGAMWWAIITMTTVGYGDISPTTPSGKVIGKTH